MPRLITETTIKKNCGEQALYHNLFGDSHTVYPQRYEPHSYEMFS